METYTIERIEIWSLARVLAVMAVAWAIIISLVWLVMGFGAGPTPGIAELLLYVVVSPLVGGFVGLVVAILFNLAVVVVGGLEIDLDGQ